MMQHLRGGLTSAALAVSALALAVTGTGAVAAPSSGGDAVPATTLQAAQPDKGDRQRAAEAARALVATESPKLLLSAGDETARLRPTQGTEKGLYYTAYERTHRGLPVVGGDFVIATTDDGSVVGVSVAQKRPIGRIGLTPALSARRAQRAARADVARVSAVARPELVVHALGRKARLAYRVDVAGREHGHQVVREVYVDARTGRVLGSAEQLLHGSGNGNWSGPDPLPLDTTQSGSTYTMRDPGIPGLECRNYSGNTVYSGPDDSWGNGSPTDRETGCVDALYAAQTEADMLRDWLGRTSFNGSGGAWPIRVGLNDVNATYCAGSILCGGEIVSIGHNQNANAWIGSLDVTGHEFGHGLDNHSGAGGISGGATGEFIGDTFAALTEHYDNQPTEFDPPDFTVGEEVNLVGNGPIRYGYKPSLAGHPDCYSTSVDSGPVHAGAGPGNHWFYLLSEGSNPGNGKPASPTCNGSTVTGIGIEKAGDIFYNALQMKTSSSNYRRFRVWSLTAANNLYSGCIEYNTVKAAWNAVSVPAQTDEPACDGGPDPATVVVANPGNKTGTVGTAVSPVTLSASGGTAPYTFTASGLPGGLTLSGNTISGTPTTAGTFTVSVTATDAGGSSGSVQFTWTITGGGDPGTGSPDISAADTMAHLQRLQDIATANGGNRATGQPGYRASLDWVKAQLDAAGYTTTVQQFSTLSGTSYNLIADLPGGDTSNIVMSGAHLDSVRSGPGINDNGSGSAGLLETALTLAESDAAPTKHVRFAFWGAEEQGLLGSSYYVDQLTTAQLDAIDVYLNFDMIASKNYGVFVYNDNPAGNAVRDQLTTYFNGEGTAWEYIDVQGRSDHASFRAEGIPTAGLFSGAEGTKTSAQASKWGGTAGQPFDPCYHSACDTMSNVSQASLDLHIDAIGHIVWQQAGVGGDPDPDPDPSTGNLLRNPGFESGFVEWTGTSGPVTTNTGRPARTGSWKLWLGGNGSSVTETINQQVTIPSGTGAATLSYYLRTDTAESGSTVYDRMRVQIVSGGTVTTLATYTNVGTNPTYVLKSLDVSAFKGKTVTVRFTATEDFSLQTSFVVDDTSLTVG